MDKKYDAIFLLAGGLDELGQVNEWVKRRCDLCIDYYQKHKVPIICLGGGTYHKPPPLNEHGFVIHECTGCINYIKQYIDPHALYKEWSSYDTIGNIYFSLINHIAWMPEVHTIMVITSEFHMERTKVLCEWIYGLWANEKPDHKKYNFIYISASDKGLENEMLNFRTKRESKSIENIKYNLIPKIKNMHDFHNWFYTEHGAYTAMKNNIEMDKNQIDENTKKSY